MPIFGMFIKIPDLSSEQKRTVQIEPDLSEVNPIIFQLMMEAATGAAAIAPPAATPCCSAGSYSTKVTCCRLPSSSGLRNWGISRTRDRDLTRNRWDREAGGFGWLGLASVILCSHDDSVSVGVEIDEGSGGHLNMDTEDSFEATNAVMESSYIGHEEVTDKGTNVLSFLDEDNPDPVKDILDTARSAHAEQKAKKGSKLHDFCLGIPYGGFLFAGGMIWFILTGSASAIQFGVVLGGLLLALSISSLNVWKKGKSSMSYIQGQAAISFLILFVQVQKAYQTRSLLPAVVALISGAMFGFYCYVFLSGGNPPKKPKSV